MRRYVCYSSTILYSFSLSKFSISMHIGMWLFCEHIYGIFMENYTTLHSLILTRLCQIDLSKQPKIQNYCRREGKALQNNIFLKIITNECFHGMSSLIFTETIEIIDISLIFPFLLNHIMINILKNVSIIVSNFKQNSGMQSSYILLYKT